MFVCSNPQCSLIPGLVDLKKCTTRKLQVKFYSRKIRTAAQETTPQIALRNCSREEGEKVSIYVIVVKGEYMQSSTYFSRRFLLVMKNSHHHEGFQCFSRYKEIHELGS